MRVFAQDRAQQFGRIRPDHPGGLDQMPEAGGGQAVGQRPKLRKPARDQMRQPLHHRHLAVMLIGRRSQDPQSQPPQQCRGTPVARPAQRTPGDAMPVQPVARAFGAEQRMAGDDLHMIG